METLESAKPLSYILPQRDLSPLPKLDPVNQKIQDVEQETQEAVENEFLKWADMSPVERLRAQYLESHGLTEQSLKALPQEEREKVEEDIARTIEEIVTGKNNKPPGQMVNQIA